MRVFAGGLGTPVSPDPVGHHVHSVSGCIRGSVSRARPRSQTRGRDPESGPDCGGEGSVQQKAVLRVGVLQEPCVEPPAAAGGRVGLTGPAPRRGPGLGSGGPSQKCAWAAKECRPRAGKQRPGEGPASKEQAAAAGGGPRPPQQAADTVRNSSGGRQMGLFRAITRPAPLPAAGSPLPSLPPPSAGRPGQLPAAPDPRCSMPRTRGPAHALQRCQG